MADVFEIRDIDGKGKGCFATKNIRKGSVVLIETPQLALENSINNFKGEIDLNLKSMKIVMSAFYGE